MRNDIGSLTKTVQGNGSERLHVMMLKQKDDEIDQRKASERELLRINEDLTCSRMSLEKKVEEQTALIVALQKGVDANSSLYAKSETDLAASRDLIEKLKSDIAVKFVPIESNVQLGIQVEDLSGKLAETEKQLNEWKCYAARKENELIAANNLLSANKKLEDDIDALKGRTASIVAELQSHIESLEKNNSESVERNEHLEQELNILKMHADRKDKNQSRSDVAIQTGDNEVCSVSVFHSL